MQCGNVLKNYIDVLNFFNTSSHVTHTGALTYDLYTKTYTLTSNVTINNYIIDLFYIQLNNGEIFDGNNFSITLNGMNNPNIQFTKGLFLINSCKKTL